MQNDYREIDLSAWTKVGEGGNGTTYTCEQEPGVILKVSHREDGTLEAISKEFYTTQAVADLGIPTPKLYEIVRVGNEYGVISQFIAHKQSVGRFCGNHPEMIETIATRVAQLGRQIHSIPVKSSITAIPSMKELMLRALATTRMISGKKLKEVTAFVESLEDASTLLHGDFSLGNLIFETDDSIALSTLDDEQSNLSSYYWIDLGRAVHGIPMFDLGHMYLFCNIFSKQKRVQQIAHMTQEQLVHFWNAFAKAYLSLSDDQIANDQSPMSLDAFNAQCKRFASLDVLLLGHIQTLNWHERLFLGLLARSLFKS